MITTHIFDADNECSLFTYLKPMLAAGLTLTD